MTRALRAPRSSSARVVALLLLAGVSVSACADTPAGDSHDHGSAASSQEADAAAVATDDRAGATDDHAGHEDGDTEDHGDHAADGHVHDDGAEATAFPTGPPRPADPDVACGTTVLTNGEQITRYCGDGAATFVVADEKETQVLGAVCEDRGVLFLSHFGTNYSDDHDAYGDYLGLALENMPETEGSADIYALELTIDGYRQAVAEAEVDVLRDGNHFEITLTGELADGRSLSVESICHTEGEGGDDPDHDH